MPATSRTGFKAKISDMEIQMGMKTKLANDDQDSSISLDTHISPQRRSLFKGEHPSYKDDLIQQLLDV